MMKSFFAAAFIGVCLSCSSSSDCAANEYCQDNGGTGLCTPKVADGFTCSTWDVLSMLEDGAMMCESGYCTSQSTCGVPAANGEACVWTTDCASNYCKENFCAARVGAGGACDEWTSALEECVEGYYCTASLPDESAPGTCALRLSPGSLCTISAQCVGLTPQCTLSDSGKTKGKLVCSDPFGAALKKAGGMLGGLLAALIIIPILLCICCAGMCFYFLVYSKKQQSVKPQTDAV